MPDITINWTENPLAEEYSLARYTNPPSGGAEFLGVVSGPPYVDVGMPSGNTYEYKVCGLRGGVPQCVSKAIVVPSGGSVEDFPMSGLTWWFDIGAGLPSDELTLDYSYDPDYADVREWKNKVNLSGPMWIPYDDTYADNPYIGPAGVHLDYFGAGFPTMFFGNSTFGHLGISGFKMTGAPAAVDAPCTLIYLCANGFWSGDAHPRPMLMMGKLGLYGKVGDSAIPENRNWGLLYDGGFVNSGVDVAAAPLGWVLAATVRSYDDIDLHTIYPVNGSWVSTTINSGGAWQSHGQFSMGLRPDVIFPTTRMMTAGVAIWNRALSSLELQKAVAYLSNLRNLQNSPL